MSETRLAPPVPIVPTDLRPEQPARQVGAEKPRLLLSENHRLCPGCGEPLAVRMMLEAIEEVGMAEQAVGVVGIGCYTTFSATMDVDVIQALHGRAPSVATGAKRMLPDALVFTLQGDGDMVNEGLQEVVHTAARGENLTCVLINNGVFGETGGHMTATTVIGQRTQEHPRGPRRCIPRPPNSDRRHAGRTRGNGLRGKGFGPQRGWRSHGQAYVQEGLRDPVAR